MSEIKYYCEQGDPYCVSPKCLCNTIRPKNVEKESKEKEEAEKLLIKFFPDLKESIDLGLVGIRKKYAKKCALTVIDIIIKEIYENTLYVEKHRYWQSVRQELEKK